MAEGTPQSTPLTVSQRLAVVFEDLATKADIAELKAQIVANSRALEVRDRELRTYMDSRFATVDARFAALSTDVSNLTTDVSSLKENVSSLTGKVDLVLQILTRDRAGTSR